MEKVQRVEAVGTLADARRPLRGGINTVFIDPIGLGLDEGSEFVFGVRDLLPDVVFVLYVDRAAVQASRTAFFAGRRERFRHYFTLDKRTPMLLFEEEVYAVLRGVRFDLLGNLPREKLTRLLEGGQAAAPAPAVPNDRPPLQEVFSLNLGELRARVGRLTADEAVRRTSLALLETLSRIDRIGKIDPEAAIAKARAVTESIVTPLYLRQAGGKAKPLFQMIEELRDKGALPPKIYAFLHTVRVVGNLSVHYRPDSPGTVTPSDVSLIGMITAQVIEWYIGPGA
jgi:hypothetical protein